MNRITEVVNNQLCTGCGTCVGVCPAKAIEMQTYNGIYLAQIQEKKCNYCSLCFESCPGHFVDFRKLNAKIFGIQPNDRWLGNYMGCYIGYSTDDKIRRCSSSGGLVTQLLIFALEKNIIDGALVVCMRKDRPLEPEAIIAKTKGEIISASKSKYCPVALNVALKQILKENGKFAIVGLPCHIHGVRKAEIVNEKLEEKIVLRIGLFCSHTCNFKGTEFILEKINVKKDNLTKLDYRGTGWPGGMTLVLKNGGERFIPYHKYYSILGSWFFTPSRCALCTDVTNELADISFGDAWLPEFKRNRKGISVIITRSKFGEEILKDAQVNKKIFIMNTTAHDIVRSQKKNLKFKKKTFSARFWVWKKFGKVIPNYNLSDFSQKPELMSLPNALLCYFIIHLSTKSSSLLRLLLFLFWNEVKISLLIRRLLFSPSSPECR